jgi:hypothetical protein
MTPDAMIKEGIRLYKAGKKAEARALWEKVTEEDQMNEQAWLWLSAVVESVDDQRTCLENVIYINPNNTNARKGLEMLEAKAAKEKPAPPPPPPDPEPVRQSAPPPPTATSSASSTFTPEEPEPEVYDNWIGSLNIGNKGADKPSTAPFTVPDGFDDASFAEDNFDDFSFDDEEDAPAPSTSKAAWQGNDLRSAFMDDDDEMDFDSDPFASDPFADDPFADDDEPNLRSGPFSAAALDDDDDDEVVDASALRGIQAPPAPIPMPRRASPPTPSPMPAKQQNLANTNASRYFVADDVKPLDEPDPSEYFAAIPEEIKATRLPGTDERRPRLLMIGLALLVLLNLVAVGLLIFQLVG